MQFGVDIPFWWQMRNETSRQIEGLVTFRGVQKPASYHCIDLLDNVGVMNYRDRADGGDGMIAHGSELLQYAQAAQHATVHMGIETFAEPVRRTWFVAGLPRREFVQRLGQSARNLAGLSRLDGYRLITLDDGQRVHVGLQWPDEGAAAAHKLVSGLHRLRSLAATDHEPSSPWVRASHDLELEGWRDFRRQDVPSESGQPAIVGFEAEMTPLGKTTFADDTWYDLQSEAEAADEFFARFAHYGGLAIHYYEPYREKRRQNVGRSPK